MLKTERLILRQWANDDFEAFAQMCADTEVMEFFPSVLDKDESFKLGAKIQSLIEKNGWGFWAVEIPKTAKFIGFVGLHSPVDALPFAPCVEVGWRIAKPYWGQGIATEAASCALDYAFKTLLLDEVVAFTTKGNLRSQAVMQKLGMTNTQRNFMHPEIGLGHPLAEHVLYKIKASEWSQYSGA